MSDTKKCLFCGKSIAENQKICNECNDHVEHQYDTDLLSNEEDVQLSSQELASSLYTESTSEEKLSVEEQAMPLAPAVPSKSKISKGMLFLIIGSIILIGVGIYGALDIANNRNMKEVQENYWLKIVEENTSLAYSKYLIRYPDGEFAVEAEKRIREFRETERLAWEKLQESGDINDFYAYLAENPKTPYISRIHMLMDSLSWMSTVKDNTADGYKAYMENVNLGHFSGAHMSEAQDRYDYLSQIEILSGATLESFKLDLVDFFEKMSENKPKDLLKEFAPKAHYFQSEMSSTDIVASIAKKYTKEKIKKITYKLNPESVSARKDNQGIVFAELSFEKEIDYNVKKKKNDKLTQKVSIEMTGDKLVRSIRQIK